MGHVYDSEKKQKLKRKETVIMAKCGNCGQLVDGDAPYCPSCGRKNPGAGQDFVKFFVYLFLLSLALGAVALAIIVFNLPAILVVWRSSKDFEAACHTAIANVWCWLASLGFWTFLGTIGFFIYKRMKK